MSIVELDNVSIGDLKGVGVASVSKDYREFGISLGMLISVLGIRDEYSEVKGLVDQLGDFSSSVAGFSDRLERISYGKYVLTDGRIVRLDELLFDGEVVAEMVTAYLEERAGVRKYETYGEVFGFSEEMLSYLKSVVAEVTERRALRDSQLNDDVVAEVLTTKRETFNGIGVVGTLRLYGHGDIEGTVRHYKSLAPELLETAVSEAVVRNGFEFRYEKLTFNGELLIEAIYSGNRVLRVLGEDRLGDMRRVDVDEYPDLPKHAIRRYLSQVHSGQAK